MWYAVSAVNENGVWGGALVFYAYICAACHTLGPTTGRLHRKG